LPAVVVGSDSLNLEGVGLLVGALDHMLPLRIRFRFALACLMVSFTYSDMEAPQA
jgi:hypothetical protein